MAQSSWPTTAGSRAVSDVQWEKMAAGFAGDGVIGSPTDTPVVYADSTGMQVKVRANKNGLVRGRGWDSGSSEFNLTVTANASGSTRIDLVVLRLTRSTWETAIVVKAGSPGAGAPALTQDAVSTGIGTWEVALAQVTVINGAATIAASDVLTIAKYIGASNLGSRPKLMRDRAGPAGSFNNTAGPTSDSQTGLGMVQTFRTTFDKVSPDTNLEAMLELSGFTSGAGRVYGGVRVMASGFTSVNYVVAAHYYNYPVGVTSGLSPSITTAFVSMSGHSDHAHGVSPGQHNHAVSLPGFHQHFTGIEHIAGLSPRTYTVQAFIYTTGVTFTMDINDALYMRLAEV